jgi:hypothetical protein
VGEGATEGNVGRYTVDQAADILGISTGAVRSRLSRGTLRSVKESGTVYVLLPAGMPRDATDTQDDMPPSDSEALTSELRDRLRYVEAQLEAERQAHSEARRIIAGLVERIPAIEAPQEASEASETVEEESERAAEQPHSATGGAQEGTQRPWWRRVFGR